MEPSGRNRIGLFERFSIVCPVSRNAHPSASASALTIRLPPLAMSSSRPQGVDKWAQRLSRICFMGQKVAEPQKFSAPAANTLAPFGSS